MEILCPVSLGEALDKISILRIKQRRISDQGKLAHVEEELARLGAAVGDLDRYKTFLDEFDVLNGELWEIEDAIRKKENARQFDEEFIRLARSVYVTNDKRFDVKNRVNQAFGSDLQEQKSYEKYR
jgi:hypothetical protein